VSNYFQSLKRLEQEQALRNATPGAPATRVETVDDELTGSPPPTDNVREIPEVTAEPVNPKVTRLEPRPDVVHEATALRVLERPSLPREGTVGSFTALFDNLRAIGNGAPIASVVISAASMVESVDRISNGLADEVCRHSLRVVVAELSRSVSQPILKIRLQSRDTDDSDTEASIPHPAQSLVLDLRGGPVPQELTDWMTSARAHYDMVILEAPPLGLSVDAAMLARACDGLILTAEARGTSKDMLMDAVGRADTVGCPLLGIVMQGRPEWTPWWLRRVMAVRNLF
jgi:hypothetical protein